MFAQQTWAPAITLALSHVQETFCDFVGLRVFGQAYLQAYAYLLAPNVSLPRSLNYPNAMKRVNNLTKAAGTGKYNVGVPEGFADLFQDRPEPNLGQAEKYRLEVADNVLDGIVDMLMVKAAEAVGNAVTRPDDDEAQRIYNRFRLVVPTNGCRCLADILNAAWIAFCDSNLWTDIPQIVPQKDVILPELVLKNIEIFEVEQILGEKK